MFKTRLKTGKVTFVSHVAHVAYMYPNQLNTLKKYEIALPQIPSHIFWSFLHGMTQTIWFSNQNVWFFHVNGKTPCSYKFLVLTDCWIRHDHHDICVGCKDINECSKAWIPYLHALKMSMQFAGKDGYAQLKPSKAWKWRTSPSESTNFIKNWCITEPCGAWTRIASRM